MDRRRSISATTSEFRLRTRRSRHVHATCIRPRSRSVAPGGYWKARLGCPRSRRMAHPTLAMEPSQDSSRVRHLPPAELVKLLISRRPIERLWPHFRDKVSANRFVLRDLETGEVYVALASSPSIS